MDSMGEITHTALYMIGNNVSHRVKITGHTADVINCTVLFLLCLPVYCTSYFYVLFAIYWVYFFIVLMPRHLQLTHHQPPDRMSYGSIDGGSFGSRNPFGGPTRQGYQPVGRNTILFLKKI